MAHEVVALGDIGATNTRLVVKDLNGLTIDEMHGMTIPGNYTGSVDFWVGQWSHMAGKREIVAASLAVAAEVDPVSGVLTKSGGLHGWIGRNPAQDISRLLNRPVGVRNDVAAIAASQQYINARNGLAVPGIASTLSSGWGGARYEEDSGIFPDEPGHEFLREGATCPCGEDGHAEAWIAGGGKKLNTGQDMQDWLKHPANAQEFVKDLATAVISSLLRHERNKGFWPEEWRWTGSVALNQQFLMQSVAQEVRSEMGTAAPAFDTATMGAHAGLHGMFVHARELAQAA
ncbi:MAG TPA: ROK family protein [Candidatus Saccharimonadales bacterium]|nr:ROK family protein [Candidatus Saccharimonadales bacterium]